ncbi:MAG: bifunctional phosphoribosylaminoimidazolecarboxamide formyltransferase/IMP cyclohydrolase [Chitinophagaceae bacterium]|nr:bifunctional phosphoribosylaminoimidazolecarboxamide formyltransferase/IMP cyclohydrolase [Oligoflexus sp.]
MTSAQKPLALISVTDKTGVVSFARALVTLGFEILSTGGTAKLLQSENIVCTEAATYTGSPEILDGRVKTLHPKIHGGILFDRNKETHRHQVLEFGIRPIDLVVANLYDFAKKALEQRLDLPKAIEFIDIGGPCMLRAAAKNYLSCAPVIDPSDYGRVLEELQSGGLHDELRRMLAGKVFRHISQYDGKIASYFEGQDKAENVLPHAIALNLKEVQPLRYGENPHQQAKFYHSELSIPGGLQDARILQGKELSYNNLLDIDGAAQLVADFPEFKAIAVIKHTNPCGVAIGARSDALLGIYERALAADPKSAFGGIVAFNTEVDAETAKALAQTFLECIVAPRFSTEAQSILAAKKNLRLLELPYLINTQTPAKQIDMRTVIGGVLVQERDVVRLDKDLWTIASKAIPTAQQENDMVFAQRVCKHVKSNAIVYAKDGVTLAVGAGQMSRIDSALFAAQKAAELRRSLQGAVMASDAFFPFRDSVDTAAKLGIASIVQPGGSMRDDESIAAANEHGIAMVFSQIRHFKH